MVSILIFAALFFSVSYCVMCESRTRQEKCGIREEASSGNLSRVICRIWSSSNAMYRTPGVLSHFRREDIADCLLVPFDFFLSFVRECAGRA